MSAEPHTHHLPRTSKPIYDVLEFQNVPVPLAMPIAPQHAVLDGISYETYERILEEIGDRQLRLTYDSGRLEIMSASLQHERVKVLLRRMIQTMTEELNIPIMSGGSTTWRRRDLEKGLEPDECYWVQSEAQVRGRMNLDLRVDPPPDLAAEVDVHGRCVPRMPIYGALGVPEVWRWMNGRVVVHLRREDGSYEPAPASTCFPWLPMDAVISWLDRSQKQDETSLIRAFRVWVRDNLRIDG